MPSIDGVIELSGSSFPEVSDHYCIEAQQICSAKYGKNTEINPMGRVYLIEMSTL